ncbi:hypothetical protein ABZZ44_23770 [Streptomyces sp. NPDC006460]|uniref:hypothetical protein n=1 Tax=Streptomyces sp. NPDC006460 TaxID=3154304 RepID=UPI0033B5CC26
MQPVLEIYTPDGFDLWPVAEVESFGFLPLSGGLTPAGIGTAVMRIASCNDIDPEGDRSPRPADALDSFLHGLLTLDNLFAAGGLRVTDNSTGVTFLPGCCDGLEDWRDWRQCIDDGCLLGFGHDPWSPVAERFGDTVRLTVNADQSDSPVNPTGHRHAWTVPTSGARKGVPTPVRRRSTVRRPTASTT